LAYFFDDFLDLCKTFHTGKIKVDENETDEKLIQYRQITLEATGIENQGKCYIIKDKLFLVEIGICQHENLSFPDGGKITE